MRKVLLSSLDDLLVITREFIHPRVSPLSLDCCLRRHGVSRLAQTFEAQFMPPFGVVPRRAIACSFQPRPSGMFR